MLLPGMIVEHHFRDIGLCTVVRVCKTEFGWPVVEIRDSTGQVHQVDEKYLRRIGYERITKSGVARTCNRGIAF